MNIALILAGGIGSRACSKTPKQFLKVNGKPIIIYTLEKFQKCKEIDEICITCLERWITKLKDYVNQYEIDKVTYITRGG